MVTDCLCTLLQQAKKDGAAIVIPNYLSLSGNSALIQAALEETDFDGPVINVSLEDQTAVDRATFSKQYSFGDKQFNTGILLKRATHSFQVQGTKSFSRIAARLVNAIAGGFQNQATATAAPDAVQQEALNDFFAKRNSVVAVVAGGGAAVLEHIAETVKEKIPLIVLSGSGRLCNFLPAVYLRRFSPGFNVYQESIEFCKECGFPEKDNAGFGRWVREIVQDGHVKIHELKKDQFALKRILSSIEHDDEALKQASRRYTEYTLAADSIERPKAMLLYMKVALSFIISLLSTILHVGTDTTSAIASSLVNQTTAIPTVTQADADVAGGGATRVVTVILPIVLSVIMSIQQDFNYGPKLLALRYGAALVESETYRYRTRTNEYSDESISQVKTGSDGEDALAEANVSYDTQSERAQKLSKELIRIGAKVATFDRPDEKDLATRLKEAAKKASQDKSCKVLPIERSPSEYRFGILNGDEYLKRAMKESSGFENRADRLSKLLTIYKILTYCVGALGSVFALINLEVRHSTNMINNIQTRTSHYLRAYLNADQTSRISRHL